DATKSHHMVIQDDAVLCRDLPAGVESALAEVPADSIMGLYLGRTRAWRPIWMRLQRVQPGLRWVRMAELMWGVGVVVPTRWIDEIVEIGDEFEDIPNYDSRISAACMRLGLPVYYPWPSLVSHRASPSLVEGRGWRGRYAYRFIGEHASALTIRWRGPAVSVQPPAAATGSGTVCGAWGASLTVASGSWATSPSGWRAWSSGRCRSAAPSTPIPGATLRPWPGSARHRSTCSMATTSSSARCGTSRFCTGAVSMSVSPTTIGNQVCGRGPPEAATPGGRSRAWAETRRGS